ncbi:CoA transferase [Dactylosporangium sp. NPDC005572]|uniref:CaiB/BaiF CoA transferase family protein n=1 Tax=Dactylosporangium sp. NPDC005572 TaxID=3156889 RepID=UPI0033B395B2
MNGIRVVEVAQFTYVPAAGAVLADWGADVIKVEHAVSGDAQRGFAYLGSVAAGGNFAPLMEHPNRGKRSVGLALEKPEALEVLYDIVRRSDVFVTNFLADARRRLKIDVDDIRKINPNIIYVRGTALGARGPEADRGGFDQPTFWCRGGSAVGVTPPGLDGIVGMPGPAYGDSIGAMTIAGGISAALFARERTGEPSVVDVSLLSAGAWANALAIDLSLINGEPWRAQPLQAGASAPKNPLVGFYRTSDDRYLNLSMLQPGRYFGDFCAHIDRPDLPQNELCDTTEKLMANAAAVAEIIAKEIAARPFSEWLERFATLEGQWAPVLDSLEVAHDVQLRANGFIAEVTDVDGNPRELVTAPVQFDETPASLTRGPQFAEHTDEVLRESGRDDEAILALKLAGAAT